jgi:hypothetical protein
MAKGKNRINKAMNQAKHFQKLNKKYYVRMREAELKLDAYEEKIAGQVTLLTSHYEGIICFLLDCLGNGFVYEESVAAWAEGKEYALASDKDEDGKIIWVPVVREVKEDEDIQEEE